MAAVDNRANFYSEAVGKNLRNIAFCLLGFVVVENLGLSILRYPILAVALYSAAAGAYSAWRDRETNRPSGSAPSK